MTDKPKRVMTPEQLERLKLAREKALAVRQSKAAKINEIKNLEKQAQEKEINTKLNELKQKVTIPDNNVVESPSPEPKAKAKASKKKDPEKVKQKLEKLIESDSDDTSDGIDDSSSDDEDVVKRFLKDKYKTKYKEKYSRKVDSMLLKGHSANYIKSRVNEDLVKLAARDLFS